MRVINVNEIKPGMILAERLVSPRGQLLAEAGTSITAQQLLHATYYGIEKVAVQDEEEAIDKYDDEAPDEFIGETQSWRILNSREFKEFKQAYNKCTDKLEAIITDFVENKVPIESEEIVEEIHRVFEKHSTGLGIMAMMLNIQELDASTFQHCVNVAIISRVCGGWIGITDEKELDVLTMCGLYHDIGKSLVPHTILTKPDKLTKEEYARMAEHPLLGYNLLMDAKLDRRIKLAALQHHERNDGSGYPYGLTKDFISPFSKIIGITDVYDAMTADRVYRAGICPFEVIAQFQREDKAKYDQHILQVFLENIAESYIGTGVLLSDDSRGIISMINSKALSCPLVKMDDGSFIDLRERSDLFIRACI
ncbi:HDIG domain-containing protein [Pseudobutyrivibrio sp. 49]|uniref:HD-GYP domain-containing protein n=1 Tax=unclassified Pseudobutyrivibrio TaxID=2638619 RepID=UPI00088C6E98|nr:MULTISPECIES: HD-GYP domain-containing protein [unclassified Pseudobutyrivibrio]SDI04246.1 HDIG domain-containing protein [Pseudobutyrivibrio sp. 49]SFO25259.1 HDIG domain-containing protein [Pseudobutyrivibrio sp. UC1225]